MSVSDFTFLYKQLLPEPHAGLLSGILFGTKENLPPNLYQDLLTTGTLHIVALSGMNISILTVLISNSLLWYVSRKISSLLTIVLIIGFILFVGPSPSVIRAGIMASLTLIAIILGRQSWSLFFLFAAGLGMLSFRPSLMLDVSFQLSFLATLGLILFGSTIQDKNTFDYKRRYHSPFASLIIHITALLQQQLRITLAAQVFTLPVILFTFHRVSIVSPLSNVLIGWSIAPLMVAGALTGMLAIISRPLATPFSWITWLFLEFIIRVIEVTAAIPFASISL